MRYNIKLSAERIRQNRESMKCRISTNEDGKKIVELVADQTEKEKSAPMSQENLLRYMHQLGLDTIGRNKLSALENAEPEAFYSLTIKQWKALADVFGVSIENITGQEPYQTPTIKALCEITGLSIPAAELLQEWKETNPEWINHIDSLITEPDFKNILQYMTALVGTAEFSAKNYYRKKNYEAAIDHLEKKFPNFKRPEPDEITEKMHDTLVELAQKSDVHEIGRIMENIMDMFYVKAIDKAYLSRK